MTPTSRVEIDEQENRTRAEPYIIVPARSLLLALQTLIEDGRRLTVDHKDDSQMSARGPRPSTQ
jgi:hypothetical protein